MYEVDSSASIQIQTFGLTPRPLSEPFCSQFPFWLNIVLSPLYCQLFVFAMTPCNSTPDHDHTTSFYNPTLSHPPLSKSTFDSENFVAFWTSHQRLRLLIKHFSFEESDRKILLARLRKRTIIIGSEAKDTNCHENAITKSRIMNCVAGSRHRVDG